MNNKDFINELAQQNNDNYKLYLERMTKSFEHSSKGLIPFFVKGYRALDVGCGSGVLMKALRDMGSDIEIEGIDLNEVSSSLCREMGFTVHNTTLSELADNADVERYDCIIFSSVLHEFSSYDTEKRFSCNPVTEALEDAKKLLNDGGIIIIRDGLQADVSHSENKNATIYAKTESAGRAFLKYFKDIDATEMFSLSNPDCRYERVVQDESADIPTYLWAITANKMILKEFLFTYTWGEESYPREVNEKFGIFSKARWEELVRNTGYSIKNIMLNSDEYINYISRDFIENEALTDLLEASTILIVAQKTQMG